jgi:hypothetical protein
MDWLAALPAGPLLEESFVLAHGSPADEDAYLLDYEEVYPLSEMLAVICFIGHLIPGRLDVAHTTDASGWK